MTIGERIKKVRENLEMSQVEFADKIRVSKQTLYKYENNLITNIPSDKIEAVAKVGMVSPAYLMGWEGIELTGDRIKSTRHIFDVSQKDSVDLMFMYKELGENEKTMLLDYAKRLKDLYDRSTTLNAAHERTDITVTDEMKKHDDDIMNDDGEWE